LSLVATRKRKAGAEKHKGRERRGIRKVAITVV